MHVALFLVGVGSVLALVTGLASPERIVVVDLALGCGSILGAVLLDSKRFPEVRR